MTAMSISLDQANVLLDALEELRESIDRGMKPWLGYDGDENDPKVTEQGYRQLVTQTRIALEEGMSENRFPL